MQHKIWRIRRGKYFFSCQRTIECLHHRYWHRSPQVLFNEMLMLQFCTELRRHFVAYGIANARSSQNSLVWLPLKYWPDLTLINLWWLVGSKFYSDFTANDYCFRTEFPFGYWLYEVSSSLTKANQQQHIFKRKTGNLFAYIWYLIFILDKFSSASFERSRVAHTMSS